MMASLVQLANSSEALRLAICHGDSYPVFFAIVAVFSGAGEEVHEFVPHRNVL